jgi:preprotein translocase subunit SecG
MMGIARTIVQIVFLILSVIMTVIVLMQEGKSNGLGTLAGSSDSYWGKNKGRSMEGVLVKLTRVLLVLFLAIAAVLSIGSFQ